MCSFFWLTGLIALAIPEQISKEVPCVSFFVLVLISISDTEAIEGKASPLKPKEEILFKFSKLSFEVACLFPGLVQVH